MNLGIDNKKTPKSPRKIAVLTSTRAEYGLLKKLIRLIDEDQDLQLQLIVTGAHLSVEHGLTYKEIESDGFSTENNIEIVLSSDTPGAISKSIALTVMGLADTFKRLTPDILVVLGDRYEILAAVSTALVFNVPVAHIHGGEVTKGAIDDPIRHAVTKLSKIHFAAADEYARRIIQMGEAPGSVFTVGGLGAEAVREINLISQKELESSLQFSLGTHLLLVTYHPVTTEPGAAQGQFNELLAALKIFLKKTGSRIIFTLPNSDFENSVIRNLIDGFVAENREQCASFSSLGQTRYLSALKFADVVVGNSSSGITEAPSFKTATVNIGARQEGRIMAPSVVSCEPNQEAIRAALDRVYEKDFQNLLGQVSNPYAKDRTSETIRDVLKQIDMRHLRLPKKFYDQTHVPPI